MPLKPVIDRLEDIALPLREHYVKAEDGKFRLALDGEHPDTAKVREFRDSNTRLMAEVEPLKAKVKQFEGIDPAAIAADKAKAAELDATKAQLAARDAELATEKAARADAQKKADRGLLRDALRTKLLSVGVLPAALDIALDKAEPVFEVKDDAVVARPDHFSKAKPGEPLTPDEWILGAIKEFPFLWKQSSGGGASPTSSLFGGTSGQNVLKDPTPQQLGQHAADIKSGKLKVEYSG